ncbi:hypothetical protein P4U05_11430 [Bacillus paranthracis]|uniref:hypothetical protein n=1 Tax=Bacillus paranthracis TaxID=2026186 RepID=UPI000200EC44|nr:hypothetical protein [Bacillus paranthracis]ADY19625.1 hypothetical protein YBT020_01865 [Bacillus thuringiensis serovar finitimus YBT-020]MRC71198.1 hypothetical protein [Bacillus thuringiensis]MCR6800066.1 hypothetical protein [Bacillus paranthracis]MEC3359159.1 hypothetical protein [Bacillus paranthracis]MED0782316.1 hypothetical protein [Bacillus paranthracis]
MKIVQWLAFIYWSITGIAMIFGYEPLRGLLVAACFTSALFFLDHATKQAIK